MYTICCFYNLFFKTFFNISCASMVCFSCDALFYCFIIITPGRIESK
uniref:Uncharacterized protein n=1 Tax=Strigamia maritima TaxID=126957 RepID=T1J4J8_STRMM